MSDRKPVPKAVEIEVLIASRRRCCLCLFLNNKDEIQKGQLAHLNRNANDHSFDNLVWLCLEHHDEYDSRTSQSKGLRLEEIRVYRDRLYARYDPSGTGLLPDTKASDMAELLPLPETSEYQRVRSIFPNELGFISNAWRYPLHQVANQPDLFAYKAGNGADGVCLLERIDLPDDRIVVACIEVAGNPGNSITNCIEELCFQVCERFEISAARMVWLEHYDCYDDEWNMVRFEQIPPQGPFANPKWIRMTPELWQTLRLKPKKRLVQWHGHYESKLIKLFDWPTRNIL